MNISACYTCILSSLKNILNDYWTWGRQFFNACVSEVSINNDEHFPWMVQLAAFNVAGPVISCEISNISDFLAFLGGLSLCFRPLPEWGTSRYSFLEWCNSQHLMLQDLSLAVRSPTLAISLLFLVDYPCAFAPCLNEALLGTASLNGATLSI